MRKKPKPPPRVPHSWDKNAKLFWICRRCKKVVDFKDAWQTKYCPVLQNDICTPPSECRKRPYRMKKEKWAETLYSNGGETE